MTPKPSPSKAEQRQLLMDELEGVTDAEPVDIPNILGWQLWKVMGDHGPWRCYTTPEGDIVDMRGNPV